MRLIFSFILCGLLWGVAAAKSGTPTPLTPYKVIKVHPHDTKAFTQGLLFHNGFLYEGTGQYTQSVIRRVDIKSGHPQQEWELPDQLFGEGLTLWRNYLFSISWRSGVGFVLGVDDLKPAGYFQYDGQGWGLADDETHLYMTDGSDRIYVREPGSFRVVRTIDVKDQGKPIIRLNELEWINGEIWANIWKENRIARIDPATGQVKAWLDLSDLAAKTPGTDNIDKVLNGIAFDPQTGRVFVTGKYWPSVYELDIEGLKGTAK